MLFQPFTLRNYQEDATQAGVKYLQRSKPGNGILILPTGSGKSLVVATIIKRLDGPALVFQPSKEILEQNVDKMKSYGYHPGIYSASIGKREVRDITFATIGSVRKHPELFQRFPYLLIDECHSVNAKGGMLKEFIEQLGKVRVLGLTATPYRLSSNSFGSQLRFLTRTRPKVFKDVVYYCQNSRLFDDGYLAKLEYKTMKGFNRSKLKANSSGADFTDLSVRQYFKELGFVHKVLDVVRQVQLLRKNCLVFTRFITEAEFIVSKIPNSAIVTGKTPKRERERILNAFKRGEIKVVCNVGVLTTGFDFPELETIIIARPTMSLALYYQMIGRGIRIHPGKKSCLVIDLCGNLQTFGKVEDLTIELEGRSKWFVSSRGRPLTNTYFERPGQSRYQHLPAFARC